jgi:predicted Rdx family selenoprotein
MNIVQKNSTDAAQPTTTNNETNEEVITIQLPLQVIPPINPKSPAGQRYPECLSSNWTREIHLPHWADLDFGRYPVCGKMKCFFNSRSSSKVGYLVSELSQFDNMMRSTYLEQELFEKFEAQVGYMPGEYPQVFNVTQDMWCLLLFLVRPDVSDAHNPGKFKYRTSKKSPVVLQKVNKAPEPYVIVGPNSERPQFTKFLHEQVHDFDIFIQTMEIEVQRMQEMVKAYPSLIHDVQVLVDTRGNVFHLDVDRVFQYEHKGQSSAMDTHKFQNNIVGGLKEAKDYAATQMDEK